MKSEKCDCDGLTEIGSTDFLEIWNNGIMEEWNWILVDWRGLEAYTFLEGWNNGIPNSREEEWNGILVD